MITYHKEYGCWFQMTENSKHYALYEAKTYKHNTTSDRVIIWDEDNDEMVNFVYGATILGVDELDKAVSDYVAEYEAKKTAKAKRHYSLNKAGVKAFEDKASADFFEEMEKPWEEQNLGKFDIIVSVGDHRISVPLGAEEWNDLIIWLSECEEANR